MKRTTEKNLSKVVNGTALFLLLCLYAFFVPAALKAQTLNVSLVDPLEKIFPETVLPVETFKQIDVAKGEMASAQVVLRSDQDVKDVNIEVDIIGSPDLRARVGQVRYVHADRHYTDQAIDRLVSASDYYPDPIIDDEPIDLKAGVSQAIYIDIPIPVSLAAGTYTTKIRVKTNVKTVDKTFDILVHDVSLAEQKLWVTNWYSLSADRLKLLNDGMEVEPYSDVYWQIIETLAEKMAQYGQNTVLISPLDLAVYNQEQGKLKIDFSHFDKTVDIFKSAGVLGRIEGGHIGGRAGDWASQFIVRVPNLDADTLDFEKLPIEDLRAQTFYKEFFTALLAHLQEKDWVDIYYQHIADEPTGDNKQSYINIASYVKSIVPDIKIMEACHSKDLAETIDLWVPQLDFLNNDFKFYQERRKQGDEVWFYTCLSPRGNYANRFLDLPLVKTRLIHWINFKYNIEGYLHWGLNYWNEEPFAQTTGINSEGGNVLPAGDSWIVYPGYRKLYSSIRLESMRDGIHDYTLLQMLEAKNPALAKKIIDNMVFRFDWYDTSISHFRKARKTILEALAVK